MRSALPFVHNVAASTAHRERHEREERDRLGEDVPMSKRTFNWDQMADKYAQVFREVIGQSPASRAYKSVKNLEDRGKFG